MTLWRIGRGWTTAERQAALATLATRPVSFPIASAPVAPSWSAHPQRPPDAMGFPRADATGLAPSAGQTGAPLSPGPRWTAERIEWVIGREPPGPPLADGPFSRIRAAIADYRFADPRLTDGLFIPETPLLGRDILVEIRVLFLRLLVGLRIGAVRDEAPDDAASTEAAPSHATPHESCFGIRMDTLDGHILHGSEWVQVVKQYQTGLLLLRIDVRWRPAPMPTWWMALGFRLFGRQIQERWRRLAARRLRMIGQA